MCEWALVLVNGMTATPRTQANLGVFLHPYGAKLQYVCNAMHELQMKGPDNSRCTRLLVNGYATGQQDITNRLKSKRMTIEHALIDDKTRQHTVHAQEHQLLEQP